MKSSIKLSALLVILSTGLFSAVNAATRADGGNDAVIVQSLRNTLGFAIGVQDAKAPVTVKITDEYRNILVIDNLPKAALTQKAYNISELEDGDYAVTISTKNAIVTKQLRVYNEAGKKAYVFLQ